MEITEIRVFPKQGQDKKLQAYVTVTFDNKFVVRNIKVIQGASGLFIAMPSRKAKANCPACSFKNEVGSKFCNLCGKGLPLHKDEQHPADPKTDHRDVAHPITQEFRDYLQSKILEAYNQEKAKGPQAYSDHEMGE
ncbi:MAG: septation protein SpoVG family protein [Candidatus Omnitrophica bacterium]|nr:septation protein SpoVG family protein [Candidatus Omnitrophota bacterium]